MHLMSRNGEWTFVFVATCTQVNSVIHTTNISKPRKQGILSPSNVAVTVSYIIRCVRHVLVSASDLLLLFRDQLFHLFRSLIIAPLSWFFDELTFVAFVFFLDEDCRTFNLTDNSYILNLIVMSHLSMILGAFSLSLNTTKKSRQLLIFM
jgi:K+-sensing histidine kinase KdpD